MGENLAVPKPPGRARRLASRTSFWLAAGLIAGSVVAVPVAFAYTQYQLLPPTYVGSQGGPFWTAGQAHRDYMEIYRAPGPIVAAEIDNGTQGNVAYYKEDTIHNPFTLQGFGTYGFAFCKNGSYGTVYMSCYTTH